MQDKEMEEMLTGLRDDYNRPPETPREEMWSAIQARLADQAGQEGQAGSADAENGVVSLTEARGRRVFRYRRSVGWAVAAAAILVLGLGIGRMTAPGVVPMPGVTHPGAESGRVAGRNQSALRVASLEHLLRTESLLTLVRADARSGRVEPQMGSWARNLLDQTRLLMDAQGAEDPVMKKLLEDLELVLIQIVGVSNAEPGDQARVRSELNMALDGLNESEVLPRIQAVVPAGVRFAGT